MSQKARFTYREFYDVPRMIVVARRGLKLLLDCKFDKVLDEYPATYRVYVLPEQIDESNLQSWEGLPEMATKYLGDLPVDQVVFDASNRLEIDTDVIDSFLGDNNFAE